MKTPLYAYLLKALRKLYAKTFGINSLQKPECDQNPDSVSQKIYETLMKDEPCMIARFGAFELATMVNYLGVKSNKKNIYKYIKGEQAQWWWNKKTINFMHTNAGFFPPTEDKIEQFCELMLKDIPEVDILGSWLANEIFVDKYLENILKVDRGLMDPFFTKSPWTKALEGKKVLVIHPFAETILSQYIKREALFTNGLLPDFNLITIKAVQSIAGEKTEFEDWFTALEYMKTEIDKTDYDICLIGAGAYGFPLAAHVKSSGKKGMHIGGSLQLFFGIIGKRWENTDYAKEYNYSKLMNEYWVRPSELEMPKNKTKIEDACYW